VKRFSLVRNLVVATMVVGFAAALIIGLWPVHANVFGDSTYSCGNGFLHSAHDWNVDSNALQFQRSADETATGLPATICPDKVNSRKDLSLLVMAISLAIGLLFTLLFTRPRERTFGSTMFANRRRAPARAPMPFPRPQPEDPGIK
jgi:hypothetical protein